MDFRLQGRASVTARWKTLNPPSVVIGESNVLKVAPSESLQVYRVGLGVDIGIR